MRLHCYLNVTSLYTYDLTVSFGHFTTRILPALSLGVIHLILCQALFTLWNNCSILSLLLYILHYQQLLISDQEELVSLAEVTA